MVPVYRQWALVPALLDALRLQTLPAARFEILLVDNDPGAGPSHGDAPPAMPGNARILPGPAPGSYAARNAGAMAARSAWLVFTDADCRPDPGWLGAFAAAAEADPVRLLAGPVRMIAPEHAPDPLNAWAVYDLIRGIPQDAYLRRGYAATANLAMPAAVFRALGGFDPARFSGGDAEFCRRAGRAGHGLALVADAGVAHPCRTSWAEITAKARRTKGGQVGAGPLPRRIAWTLRTLAPPLRDTLAYLRANAPPRHRLIAIAVRLRVWGVELAETARLIAGGAPERR
ncbi:MAG TPA: glycosyltransferase [Allosphingosinicella sp.]|nr:glycosyltransferase [Allosphingosinicella sp.]